MTRPSIQVNENLANPYFCEDKTDFHKLLYGQIKAASHSKEDEVFMAVGLRIICHEYLALILSEKMNPYEIDDEWVKKETPGFKEMIHLVNDEFATLGVPLKEGENGKLDIDYDTFNKEFEDEERA